MRCQDHNRKEAPASVAAKSSSNEITVKPRPQMRSGEHSVSSQQHADRGISGLTKEEEEAFVSRFEALKKNQFGSKKFIQDHPVCDTCEKIGKSCIVYKGVSCTSCVERHQACPRRRAFYVRGMTGFRDGMSEDEVLRILFALQKFRVNTREQGTKKPGRGGGNRKIGPKRTQRSPSSTADDSWVDSDSNSGSEEDERVHERREIPTRNARKAVGHLVADHEDGALAELDETTTARKKLMSRLAELEDEVARLEGLLAEEERTGRVDGEDENRELEKKIEDLEGQLEREIQESNRLRAELKKRRNNSSDAHSSEKSLATQQNLSFLAQIGLYASALRTQERVLRDDQGADTRGVASVINLLQSALDGAVAREHEGMLKMPGPEATVLIARTSSSKGNKRTRDSDDEKDSEEDEEHVAHASRARSTSEARMGVNRDHSTSKRVRVSRSGGKRK